MATLIKNLPNPIMASKGNRGLGFPLFTEWEHIISQIPNLVLNSKQMLIIKEPIGDSAMMLETSTSGNRVFYTIPAGTDAKLYAIGLTTDGPLSNI